MRHRDPSHALDDLCRIEGITPRELTPVATRRVPRCEFRIVLIARATGRTFPYRHPCRSLLCATCRHDRLAAERARRNAHLLDVDSVWVAAVHDSPTMRARLNKRIHRSGNALWTRARLDDELCVVASVVPLGSDVSSERPVGVLVPASEAIQLFASLEPFVTGFRSHSGWRTNELKFWVLKYPKHYQQIKAAISTWASDLGCYFEENVEPEGLTPEIVREAWTAAIAEAERRAHQFETPITEGWVAPETIAAALHATLDSSLAEEAAYAAH